MNTKSVINSGNSYTDCIYKNNGSCDLFVSLNDAIEIVWNDFVVKYLQIPQTGNKLNIIRALPDSNYAHILQDWYEREFPEFPYHFMDADPCINCKNKETTYESSTCPRTEALNNCDKSADNDLLTMSLPGGYDGAERFVHSGGKLYGRELRVRGIEEERQKAVAEDFSLKAGSYNNLRDYYAKLIDAMPNSELKTSLKTILHNNRICPTCLGQNLTKNNYCLHCNKYVTPVHCDGAAVELIRVFFQDKDPVTLDDTPPPFELTNTGDFNKFVEYYNLPANSRATKRLFDEWDEDLFWYENGDCHSLFAEDKKEEKVNNTKEAKEKAVEKLPVKDFFFLVQDTTKIEGEFHDCFDPIWDNLMIEIRNDNGMVRTIPLSKHLVNMINEMKTQKFDFYTIEASINDFISPFRLILQYNPFHYVNEPPVPICPNCKKSNYTIDGAAIICTECQCYIRDATYREVETSLNPSIVSYLKSQSTCEQYARLVPQEVRALIDSVISKDGEQVRYFPTKVKAFLLCCNEICGVFNQPKKSNKPKTAAEEAKELETKAIYYFYNIMMKEAINNFKLLWKVVKTHHPDIEIAFKTYLDTILNTYLNNSHPITVKNMEAQILKIAEQYDEVTLTCIKEMFEYCKSLEYCEIHGWVKGLKTTNWDTSHCRECRTILVNPYKEIWKRFNKTKKVEKPVSKYFDKIK